MAEFVGRIISQFNVQTLLLTCDYIYIIITLITFTLVFMNCWENEQLII